MKRWWVLVLLLFLLLVGWLVLRQHWPLWTLLREPAPQHLPSPLPGRALTDTWGAARSGGRRHEGIDIFAARDTPIRATTRGLVVSVGWNELGGRTISVLGPGRQKHYYAHLERYAHWKVGEWVQAGQVVGYVGDSGNAKGTPPHLHYGIYTLEGPINPYPLLKR